MKSFEKLNKNYVTEESGNRSVSSIDDLKVKNPTVIKITDDKVVGYYEGNDEWLKKAAGLLRRTRSVRRAAGVLRKWLMIND